MASIADTPISEKDGTLANTATSRLEIATLGQNFPTSQASLCRQIDRRTAVLPSAAKRDVDKEEVGSR